MPVILVKNFGHYYLNKNPVSSDSKSGTKYTIDTVSYNSSTTYKIKKKKAGYAASLKLR